MLGCSEGDVLVSDVSFVLLIMMVMVVVLFLRYLGLRDMDLRRRRDENRHFLYTMKSLNRSDSLQWKDGKSMTSKSSSKKHL